MKKRYTVDIRIGIVAVIDTHHADYHRRNPGLHGDEEWVVAYWNGSYIKCEWVMEAVKINMATKLCDLLNNYETLH